MYFCSTVIVQDWNYQTLQAIRCKAIWTVLYLFITHTVMILEGLSLWQLVLWFWQLLCLCCWWNKLAKLRRHACRVQKCTLDKYTLEKYTLKKTHFGKINFWGTHFEKIHFRKIHLEKIYFGKNHFGKIHLGKIHFGKYTFGQYTFRKYKVVFPFWLQQWQEIRSIAWSWLKQF